MTAKFAGWKKGEGINFVQAKKITAEAAHIFAAEVKIKNQVRVFLKMHKNENISLQKTRL